MKKHTNLKFLIIGADGFLGRNLSLYFDRRGIGYEKILRSEGDLRDMPSCEKIFSKLTNIDKIFNLVTFQRTGNIQYEIPADLLMNNIQINTNLIKCWIKYLPNAKFIAMGSSCSYPESNDPITESMFGQGKLHESVQFYGFAKNFLASALQAYNIQHKAQYLYCVLSTMYGPYDHIDTNRSHFVNGMMWRAINEKRSNKNNFTVWGSPDNVRECLYVDDQIEAILLADQLFENCVVNCSSNQYNAVKISDLAQEILRVIDWNAPIEYSRNTFLGAKIKTLDSTKFLQKSGWLPRIQLSEGLIQLKRYLETL